MNILRCLVAATVCLLNAPWSVAAPPSGVLDLFTRLPDPPATAEEAARWMDKDGKLVHAPLIALKADIEAHRKAVAAPMQAQAPAQRVQAKMQVTTWPRAWPTSASTCRACKATPPMPRRCRRA